MKRQSHYLKKFLFALFLITALSGIAQQQFIHTASKANNYCNGNCTTLDVPELNNNPAAIIWVTPILEDGRNINTHPIGAYYFESRWRIFNIDQTPMPPGAKFKVEYIANADRDRFKYIVTDDLLQKDGSAFIDNPELNDNPDAKFNYFLNWNPAEQRGTNNRNEVKIDYNADAGKWYFSNINKKPLYRGDAYNIIINNNSIVSGRSSDVNKALQINELITTPGNVTTSPNSKSDFGEIHSMYMTVWADGIKLPGDNFRKAHLEQTEIFDFEMGSARPSSSGQISANRMYEPVIIKSRTGFPGTIPLFNAFTKNQAIAITIDTYTISLQTGVEVVNYSIKLTGASIVSFKQVYEGLHKGRVSNQQSYDEIKILFKKIEYTKGKGGQFAEDNGL